MLLARRKRRKLRMPDYHAGWNPGIGGHCFVAGIASDDPRARRAHHPRQHQGRRPVAIILRELLQTAGVAINHSSRRDAMDKFWSAEPLIAQRARKRRRA